MRCRPQPLASCTAPMDPDTWSAYHVVSNRARAVCYAARQLEFRRRAEHAVAALAAAASDQLEAARALKVRGGDGGVGCGVGGRGVAASPLGVLPAGRRGTRSCGRGWPRGCGGR